jgi:HNH endonuclease
MARFGPRPRSLAERFWEKVQIGGLDECWPFVGARGPRGTGRIGRGGRRGSVLVAARVAFMLTRGTIPEGFFVCHHCDHPWCCNPVCLFAGTPLANSRDMIEKDRQARGKLTAHLGEENGRARLSAKQVIEIRTTLRHESPDAIKVVAHRFDVTPQNVRRILRGKTWRHL